MCGLRGRGEIIDGPQTPIRESGKRAGLPGRSGKHVRAKGTEKFLSQIVAEREGFEPSVRLPVRSLSKGVLSTTQPPFRVAGREV